MFDELTFKRVIVYVEYLLNWSVRTKKIYCKNNFLLIYLFLWHAPGLGEGFIEDGLCQIKIHLNLHFRHFQWNLMKGNTVQENHGNKNRTVVLGVVFIIWPHPSSLLTPDSHLICSFSHKKLFISENQEHFMLFHYISFCSIFFEVRFCP